MVSLRLVRPLTILVGALALAFMMTALAPAATAGGTLPACAVLAADPAVAANPTIKSASSAIVAAAGKDVAYCKVHLLYGTNPNQNINIVVDLLLNSVDGGSGGVQGSWNGRTQGLGGGGCAGNLVVTPAVDAG